MDRSIVSPEIVAIVHALVVSSFVFSCCILIHGVIYGIRNSGNNSNSGAVHSRTK